MSFAKANMQIISDKSVIEKDEEINISINIDNTEIAALTLEIYSDNTKLEYISGPENSNNASNRILYTWISEKGENVEKLSIENFKFKALENGIANIAVIGEFYNSNGDKVNIDTSSLELKIGRDENKAVEISTQNITPDNTNLSILRLNHEGISPEFNKDIKEYYFVTNDKIEKLDITAVPENPDATVTITGNNNLKIGENVIEIKVESQDRTKTSSYKINLTKTSNLETANANLETLAVREASLEPEFDNNITQYKLEIPNEVDKIDVLAIPQRENAKVRVSGSGEMQIGNNKIEIDVTAENGTTHKKYEILVHRRNAEEEQKNKEEEKVQAERLTAILQEEQSSETSIPNSKTKNIAPLIFLITIAISVIIAIYFKKKIKNNKK